MKILLTNSKLHYSHGPKFLQPDWVNLTLPYIAAIAGNHDIKIVDNSFNKNYKTLEKSIKSFSPDIIGFSMIAGRDIPQIIPEIKRINKTKIIAGGQGAAYNSETLENLGVTVFKDECEKALPYFLETGELKEFKRINLDDSPIPRWDLTSKTKSKTFNTFSGSIEMSRGCPYKCDFCCIASFWHSHRHKSSDRIIEELKYLNSQDRKHVYMTDDSFGIGTKRHMELLDKILVSGLNMKFFTQIRADVVANNPEMMKLAKKAGLSSVLVGYDSYDNEVLKENTKTTTVEINYKCTKVLRDNKIAIIGSHIYGLPGQKSFKKTFEVGRKNSDVFCMPYYDERPKPKISTYDPKYVKYLSKNQFSLSEIVGILAHPDKVIRELKRGGLSKYINCTLGYYLNKKKK